ncbi:MAG: hypothetical protein SOY43_03915 [Parabacteroides sp.]|nr:hypothetical protein [bacterium]MDY4102026.1 hypothetical protein [Parabacteroides sp.]
MIKNLCSALLAGIIAYFLAASQIGNDMYTIIIGIIGFLIGGYISYYNESKDFKFQTTTDKLAATLEELVASNKLYNEALSNKIDQSQKIYQDKFSDMSQLQSELNSTVSRMIESLTNVSSQFMLQNEEAQEKHREHIEAILQLHSQQMEKTIASQNINLEKSEANQESFKKCIASFDEAITQYTKVNESIQRCVKITCDKANEMTSIALDNNKSMSERLISNTNELKNFIEKTTLEINNAIQSSIELNNEAIHKVSEGQKEYHQMMLDNFLSSLQAEQDQRKESIDQFLSSFIEKQDKASKDTLNVITNSINSLNNSVRDFENDMRELISVVNKSLNTIKDKLIDSVNESNEENTEAIKESLEKISKEIGLSITELEDKLVQIALNFTDYKKEEEIIKKLERLCK